jgi:hypothetical protein
MSDIGTPLVKVATDLTRGESTRGLWRAWGVAERFLGDRYHPASPHAGHGHRRQSLGETISLADVVAEPVLLEITSIP